MVWGRNGGGAEEPIRPDATAVATPSETFRLGSQTCHDARLRSPDSAARAATLDVSSGGPLVEDRSSYLDAPPGSLSSIGGSFLRPQASREARRSNRAHECPSFRAVCRRRSRSGRAHRHVASRVQSIRLREIARVSVASSYDAVVGTFLTDVADRLHSAALPLRDSRRPGRYREGRTGGFLWADPLGGPPELPAPCWHTVATVCPLGNCDSPRPETSLAYFTRLRTASHRP
jgi:hypothetical protein